VLRQAAALADLRPLPHYDLDAELQEQGLDAAIAPALPAAQGGGAAPVPRLQLEVSGKRCWIVRLVSAVMYGDLSVVGDSTSSRYSSSRVDRVAEPSSFGSLHARVLPEGVDSMLPLGSLLLTLALPRAGGRPAALVFAVESIAVAGKQLFAIAVDALPTAQLRGRLLVLDADADSNVWYVRSTGSFSPLPVEVSGRLVVPLKARVSRFPATAGEASAAAAAAAAALDAGAGGGAGGGAGASAGAGAGAAPLAPLSAEEEEAALEESWVPGERTIALGKCPLSEAELDLAVTAAWAQCSKGGSSTPSCSASSRCWACGLPCGALAAPRGSPWQAWTAPGCLSAGRAASRPLQPQTQRWAR